MAENTIHDLPASKVYGFKRGEYLYLDTYYANGEWSGGQTLIYVDRNPAWLMQYHGWCKDDNEAILTFLKKALMFAYQHRMFIGGRGPYEFFEDGFTYLNFARMPPYEQSIVRFQGHERICFDNKRDADLFWYQYQGQLLGEPI